MYFYRILPDRLLSKHMNIFVLEGSLRTDAGLHDFIPCLKNKQDTDSNFEKCAHRTHKTAITKFVYG